MKDIELFEDDQLSVLAMLRSLYYMEYDQCKDDQTGSWWSLTRHAHVYVTAEKYGLERLKNVAASHFGQFLAKGSVWMVSEAELVDTIDMIWHATPHRDTGPGRKALAEHCVPIMERLYEQSPRFRELMDNDELTWHLCLATMVVRRRESEEAEEAARQRAAAEAAAKAAEAGAFTKAVAKAVAKTAATEASHTNTRRGGGRGGGRGRRQRNRD